MVERHFKKQLASVKIAFVYINEIRLGNCGEVFTTSVFCNDRRVCRKLRC